ncbi:winged helix-turn-helix domain-containing protein [Plantactinospora siamensis]|uniref:Winged helix-turn-helix domain-containing protein n=1 Tax=Plantactinospora siamensis TaxID=555372 RepID=A0ABV6P5W7_9ACTN
MSNGQLALVVCVSADRGLRERLMRRLDDVGPLVLCSDLAELRAMLFPAPGEVPHAPAPGEVPQAPAPGEVPHAPAPGPAAEPVGSTGADRPGPLGQLTMDPDGHLVSWRGRPLALSRLERQLLARLASPPVRVWTYERLFASVWGGAYLGDTAILHSAVKRLRRRLRTVDGGPRVQTVRGVGYRIALGD